MYKVLIFEYFIKAIIVNWEKNSIKSCCGIKIIFLETKPFLGCGHFI